MAQNHPADPFSGPSQPQATGYKRFPTGLSPGKRSGILGSQALSESPDAKSNSEPLETAEETEEEGTGMSSVEKRLDGIEQRQKRIEELLLQLTSKIGSSS